MPLRWMSGPMYRTLNGLGPQNLKPFLRLNQRRFPTIFPHSDYYRVLATLDGKAFPDYSTNNRSFVKVVGQNASKKSRDLRLPSLLHQLQLSHHSHKTQTPSNVQGQAKHIRGNQNLLVDLQ